MSEPNQLKQDPKHSYRHSYLLRLWRTDRSSSSNWQASLEDPHTNERLGFANLEQFFAHLMRLTERDNNRNLDQSKGQQ